MMEVHLLHPHQDLDTSRPLPPNHEDLIRDLELEVILEAMGQGDDFFRQVALHHLPGGLKDPQVILYRQAVLRDCLRLGPVVAEIYHTTLEFMERKSSWWYLSSTRHSNPSLVLSSSLHVLEIGLDSLRSLRRIADEHAHAFQASGFHRFFSMIQEELPDEYLAEVEDHINTLKFPKGILLTAQMGKANQGDNYQLSRPSSSGENWLMRILNHKSPVYSFTVHPRDDHGLRVLADLRDLGLARVAAAVSRAAQQVEGFFKALREELAFYLGCVNLYQELKSLGLPVTFPVPVEQEKHLFSARGLYDISLALTLKDKVVGNDIEAPGKDLIIITGPNRGGKTTFLRSVGQAQLMMECGMFVPAESFTANVSSGIFTHFKREEDKEMKGGKLDEELERMSTRL
jgi:DNA mismatch repair protein MutS